MTSQSAKFVFITGCSAGGIGSALAEAFHAQGLHVFATARDVSKMAHLQDKPNITLLSLDVTSSDSIASALEAVREKTGGKLDYLVNNAGVGYAMPLLDVDLEEARKVYDVNVWSVLAVIQVFAPLVIAAEGTIVNIGSVASQHGAPYIGVYAASKAALETMSETLRLEMAPFNVKVITIISGLVDSNFYTTHALKDLPSSSKYLAVKDQIADRVLGKKAPPGMAPENYARQVVSDVLGGANGKIWRGAFAGVVRFVMASMPTFVLDSMVSSETGLDTLRRKRAD